MANTLRPLFCRLFGEEDAMLADLEAACTRHAYSEGSMIVHQEDEGGDIYVIVAGQARAHLLTADGREFWIDEFGPGQFFGEMTALGAARRTCNVDALTDVDCAQFTRADFLDLMVRHGSLGLAISRMLVHRVEQTTRRLFSSSFETVKGRLVLELMRQAKPANGQADRAKTVDPYPVLTELGRRVGASRESVSRNMNGLLRIGVLAKDGNRLLIPDPDMLMRSLL